MNVYPRVKKELIDTGKVRWIVREFPIGRSAGTAAIINRCAPEKDYFVLFDKFLTQQKAWVSQEVRTDAIYKVASQTGMTRQAFDACLSNKELEEGLRTVKQRGRELGVTGTPTFFVNGKKSARRSHIRRARCHDRTTDDIAAFHGAVENLSACRSLSHNR